MCCLPLFEWGGYIANAQTVTSVSQQTGTCVGKIIDEEGEPVVGATVKVEGTANGTMTNIDGAFTLNGVKKGST
ncbi:MAG: carboxypeptidase-like regulatory domain-containing protein, partial [Paramuribaculum sp.]|nr:carboxypeptidase-like regulatory domain-containing protein [Paramuribaculum sp.]